MGKSIVDHFQSLISPFSDKEVKRAIMALYELHPNKKNLALEECSNFLYELVNDALDDGVYESLREVNLMQVILDELLMHEFLDAVAEKIQEVCKVDYLGDKMDYIDEGDTEQYLFYFDKGWYETLKNDYKERYEKLPHWVFFFFKNAKLVDYDTYFKDCK